MTNLFTRTGTSAIPQGFANGKPFITVQNPCGRCGGQGGSDAWKHTGWTCYQCAGNGKGRTEVLPLYTVEKLAQLDAAKAKADARRAAKQVVQAAAFAAKAKTAADANRATYAALLTSAAPFLSNSFIADICEKAVARGLTENQLAAVKVAIEREAAKAAKPASAHVGEIGTRKVFELKIVHVHTFEGAYGIVRINIMEDVAGNVLIYKGTHIGEKGETITVKATVKEHGERNGVAQTILARPAVVEVAHA